MAESFSVALCTYNGARFIAEQLDSILKQSIPPAEVVVSDDGSQDSTLAIVRERFARHREPGARTELRILENPTPLGVTKNFEQAILACSNELIALSDQDDVWVPDRLRRLGEAFATNPSVLLVHSDAVLIDESGRTVYPSLLDALEVSPAARSAIRSGGGFELFMQRNLVTGATMAVRRELVAAAVPFPASWVHDEWLAVVASVMGGIDLLPDRLVEYRQHGSNQIGAAKLSIRGKFARLMEPGAGRNRRLLERAAALAERLAVIPGADERQVDAARRKLIHEQKRSALSPVRLARVVPVVVELATGRYSEFGRGAGDVARDLLQPLKPSS